MVACSVLTAYFVPTAHTDSSIIMEEAVKEGATNPLNAPSGFAAPQTNDAAETPAPGDFGTVIKESIFLNKDRRSVLSVKQSAFLF